tara:strand:+ start:321 stop:911 length:591 start_codon:yes stop_codon:yes gene_type:complete
MLKKITVVTLLIGLIGFGQTEIKFNLATAPLLVPNIGIEVKLSEKIGYQLDTSASFYNDIEGSPFHMTQIFNEFRFYPNKNQKRNFFIGAHIGYGMYNIRLPRWIANISGSEFKEQGSYQYGRNAYFGITIGKKIPLRNERLGLELFIGGGSSQSNYKYYNKNEQRIFALTNYKRKFNKSGEELPYRGGLMLTYKL